MISMPVRFAMTLLVLTGVKAVDLQAQQVEVRGTIVDEHGAPIRQSLVAIQTLGLRALTGQDGRFLLIGVPHGTHVVQIAKSGFPTKLVQFEATANSPRAIDLGVIALTGTIRSDGSLSFNGTVIDEQNGDPVPAATVIMGEAGVGVTDASGVFRISIHVDDPTQPIPVKAHRVGYLPLEGSLDVAPGEHEITLRLALKASPVELAEIIVEGEARVVPAYMRGFYERQRLSNGTFFTSEDIARLNPPRVAELLRRVPGLDVIETGLSTLDEPRYRFAAGGFLGCSEANLFVDGVRVTPQSFGFLTQPERLAGIEVYRGGATPAGFDIAGLDGSTGCGAIIAWTKPAALEKGPAPVMLGVYWGNSLGRSSLSGRRLGGHMAFKFVGPLELNPSFGIISDVGGQRGSAWQLLLNLRIRPLGGESPWYVGAGAAVINIRPVTGRSQSEVGAKTYPMALTGVNATLGSVSPFGEIHIVDFAHPDAVDVNLFLGLGIRFGGG